MRDRKPVIMVAEADVELRWLYQRWLSEAGWHARPVEDGAWALALIPPDPPDVLLIDWNLPEVDGLEVCRRLKADPDLAHIGVLILAERTDPISRAQAQAAGAVSLLSKPFSRTELILRLEGLLPHSGSTESAPALALAEAVGRAGP